MEGLFLTSKLFCLKSSKHTRSVNATNLSGFWLADNHISTACTIRCHINYQLSPLHSFELDNHRVRNRIHITTRHEFVHVYETVMRGLDSLANCKCGGHVLPIKHGVKFLKHTHVCSNFFFLPRVHNLTVFHVYWILPRCCSQAMLLQGDWSALKL